MANLIKLVKSYADGELSYVAFRADFVKGFLSVRSGDLALDCAVVQIESLCADVAEGEISSEADFREKMKAIAEPIQAENGGPNPVQFFDVSLGIGYSTVSSGSTSIGANSMLQAFA